MYFFFSSNDESSGYSCDTVSGVFMHMDDVEFDERMVNLCDDSDDDDDDNDSHEDFLDDEIFNNSSSSTISIIDVSM